jgi:hypothetical protein
VDLNHLVPVGPVEVQVVRICARESNSKSQDSKTKLARLRNEKLRK